MSINYFAPVAITQALLSHFKKRNSVDITVISSIGVLTGFSCVQVIWLLNMLLKDIKTLQCELYKTNLTISLVYLRTINANISKNAL
jgi:dehydrogenase/reductase SDR family protein 7B